LRIRAGVPVQQGATAAYAQSFPLLASLDGLFATIAVNKKINVDEAPSAKVIGMTLSGKVGEPILATFDVLPSQLVKNSLTIPRPPSST